jgi:hypothetical protein
MKPRHRTPDRLATGKKRARNKQSDSPDRDENHDENREPTESQKTRTRISPKEENL